MTLRRLAPLVPMVVLALILAGCTSASDPPPMPPTGIGSVAAAPVPTGRVAAVCDNTVPGPASAPPGAITVEPAIDGDLAAKTDANPAKTTFWLAPGTHTLSLDEFGQVIPKDGNTYLGAPGAILDGQGTNYFAFTQQAQNVTIRHLTIQGFVAPNNQGVVNHDSGDEWVIEHNTIQNNSGAGMMAGARQQVRRNCLRNNGQYAINAYKAGNTITGLVVEDNEIVGNNTDDWETLIPGCGCSGGVKFWAVDGADIRHNWVHDNRGSGLWADINNNDFLIEANLIEDNDGEAVFYEASYNLILRNNTIRNNTLAFGRSFADRADNFPIAAVYISESGGEPRVPARTDKIDVYGNMFENNWSGITLWENADRFCNSAANPSGDCTRLVPTQKQCSRPGITSEPLYGDCRWKTQRVDIHDNRFVFDPRITGCAEGFAGRMAILANYGTYPDWSPYLARLIQDAITFGQQNTWRNNSYSGPWRFMPHDTGRLIGAAEWKSEPYQQDAGSTFTEESPGGCR